MVEEKALIREKKETFAMLEHIDREMKTMGSNEEVCKCVLHSGQSGGDGKTNKWRRRRGHGAGLDWFPVPLFIPQIGGESEEYEVDDAVE
jgi:hypothetical protein